MDCSSFEDGVFNYLDQLTIFNDGSKMGKTKGSAFVVYKGNNPVTEASFHLLELYVFQAEMHANAINQAADWLADNHSGKTVALYSDSQAALLALKKHYVTSALVLGNYWFLKPGCCIQ